jgi:biopolymer transport protein ExbD
MTRIPRGARTLKWRRRRQEKFRRWPSLNLVALMDVFTILVFFYLVHAADVEIPANSHLVRLPDSTADQQPRDTLVIMITRDDIRVQGEPVTVHGKVQDAAGNEITELRTVLEHYNPPEDSRRGREVTILGDKSIPFTLLKKVMVTCTRAGYDHISLAVLQRSQGTG